MPSFVLGVSWYCIVAHLVQSLAMQRSTSTNPLDYEILIRRYDMGNRYASYCPQLGEMIKGTSHQEVEEAMKRRILEHIEELKRSQENASQHSA